jgi:hypothetical protein
MRATKGMAVISTSMSKKILIYLAMIHNSTSAIASGRKSLNISFSAAEKGLTNLRVEVTIHKNYYLRT